ncbi:MAG: zinc-ribbon domain-containing protein [Acidobacteriia bacterium]|nr:zinc-ribbon domain-containing protein [Terriglobia bacterium]
MAFCTKCGGEVGDGVAFCPKCGQALTGGQVAQTSQSAAPGMAENVAGLLCYSLGWLTGIVFFLIDKRPFVKFHAAQSIVVFGGLHIINIVVAIFFGTGMMMGGFGAFGMGAALYGLISLIAFILWILLMVKAYQHEKFEIPVAAGIAKSFSGT